MEKLDRTADIELRHEAIEEALSEPMTGLATQLLGPVATKRVAAHGRERETIEQVEPAAEKPRRRRRDDVLANVYLDPTRHHVTLLLDEPHATAVIYAVRVLAAEYEAHAREVRLASERFPPDSYGARNRVFEAIRHERIASRLRYVESSYRDEVSEGWA